MPAAWSKKNERQYKHILRSCTGSGRKRSLKACKRIAAATVNSQRSAEGRTLGGIQENIEKSLSTTGGKIALAIGAYALGYSVGAGASGKTS